MADSGSSIQLGIGGEWPGKLGEKTFGHSCTHFAKKKGVGMVELGCCGASVHPWMLELRASSIDRG
jgi:hypothetical protein